MKRSPERDAAIAAGSSTYFTGAACPKGHVAARRVNGRGCVECSRAQHRRWYTDNRERVLQQASVYTALTKDAKKEYRKKRYDADPAAARERMRRYREANPEKIKAYEQRYRRENAQLIRERSKARRPKDLARRSAQQAKRKADKLKATPRWLSASQRTAITDVYAFARLLTDLTGDHYHVDHIVPLRGRAVCGLHVPWNLRAVPAEENMRKYNSLSEALLQE